MAVHVEDEGSVEIPHGLADRLLQFLHRAEEVVVDGFGFEMAPVAFDEGELRGVGGVPDQAETGAVVRDETLYELGAMDAAVVQEDQELTAGIRPAQRLEVGHEAGGGLAPADMGMEAAGKGIERAEDGKAAVLPGGGHLRLPADQPPHAAQAGIEMELALVFKEEDVPVGVPVPFFRAASRWAAAQRTARRF